MSTVTATVYELGGRERYISVVSGSQEWRWVVPKTQVSWVGYRIARPTYADLWREVLDNEVLDRLIKHFQQVSAGWQRWPGWLRVRLGHKLNHIFTRHHTSWSCHWRPAHTVSMPAVDGTIIRRQQHTLFNPLLSRSTLLRCSSKGIANVQQTASTAQGAHSNHRIILLLVFVRVPG